MEPCHGEGFFGCQRRQDSRQPFREHRLSGSGRTDEEQCVPARRGDLERASGRALAANFGEIARRLAARIGRGGRCARELRAAQPVHGVAERGHGVHGEGFDERRLGSAGGRTEERACARTPRGLGESQRAAHRTQRAVECDLAEHRAVGEAHRRRLTGRDQHAERDREIRGRAFLAALGGREIHGDASVRQLESRVAERRPHALARFAGARVGKSDEEEGGKPRTDVDLALDGKRFDAPEGGGPHAAEHGEEEGGPGSRHGSARGVPFAGTKKRAASKAHDAARWSRTATGSECRASCRRGAAAASRPRARRSRSARARPWDRRSRAAAARDGSDRTTTRSDRSRASAARP